MKGHIVVHATTFLDPLPTHPPEAGEGRRLLDEIEHASGGSLRVVYRCNRLPAEPLTPSELEGAVAVIADLERWDAPLLSAVGKGAGGPLELIARYGVGYDSVDIAAATAAGVLVTNTPGANSRPTAEWAVATLLDVAGRRMPHHERASMGEAKTGPSRLDVSGRTLGVVGTGAIGRTVVELMAGFRMKVLAHDPFPNETWAREHGVTYVSLAEVCRSADFITLHAATRDRLIGEPELELMAPRTVLVNCARGVLVDGAAAWKAVAEGRLWGYGLDEVWDHPGLPLAGLNIVVSPHVGSDTDGGKALMQLLAARSVSDWYHGRRPASVLNPAVMGARERAG